MIEKIATGAELIQAIRDVAKENPDFNYSEIYKIVTPHGYNSISCEYVDEDGCGKCIVGIAAVEKLGLDPDAFNQPDEDRDDINGSSFESIASLIVENITVNEIVWIQAVQSTQDAKGTWSEAIIEADGFVKRIASV